MKPNKIIEVEVDSKKIKGCIEEALMPSLVVSINTSEGVKRTGAHMVPQAAIPQMRFTDRGKLTPRAYERARELITDLYNQYRNIYVD
jgi:hypothetical protein